MCEWWESMWRVFELGVCMSGGKSGECVLVVGELGGRVCEWGGCVSGYGVCVVEERVGRLERVWRVCVSGWRECG